MIFILFLIGAILTALAYIKIRYPQSFYPTSFPEDAQKPHPTGSVGTTGPDFKEVQ